MELKEVETQISIPTNTGVPGFLKTIEIILRKPRVQETAQ